MMASLEAGSVIARYTVVSRLGAGGMGEVYLARDESLGRSVALKILPPDLVGSDERVRRFMQEARSASSLNHPHIVTIYEIGEAEGIHFIAMELVNGHTLKTLVHEEQTELRTVVRYLAQAADGLAKAHGAGIVHRDLKPENIMVTSDGFAKVVDFGLAKLTEPSGSVTGQTDASTRLAAATGAGTVLGTVGYMSPEQVQGKVVDHRSDIFSLGCVLYEAATRRRPFQADSDVEALHQILKDAPPPVEELNPHVPAELRRVIRRCLAKSPDRRFQSMKDVALDLSEIDESYDSLPVPTGSGTTISAIAATSTAPRSRLLSIAAFVFGLAGLSFGTWQWVQNNRGSAATSSSGLQVTTIARIPEMKEAMASADGRFLAYTQDRSGQFSLIVRQMATSQDLLVVPPQEREIWLRAIAPDSSYVYFSANINVAPGRSLHRVPAVGGEPRRVMTGDVREMAFSADGSRFVAIVEGGEQARRELIIANADGTELRRLALFPDRNIFAPAWSPDGRYVIAAVSPQGVRREQLTAFATSDGTSQPIGSHDWAVFSAAWPANGNALVVAADVSSAGGSSGQLWAVSWHGGAKRRITNDTNFYDRPLVLSEDGQTITTTVVRDGRSVYSAPADQPDQATKLPGDAPAQGSFVPLWDGRLLYRTFVRGQRALWTMATDGTRRQRITPDRLDVTAAVAATRADVVVVESSEDLGARRRLWRMDSSGGELVELTAIGPAQPVTLSPDGADLYYLKRAATGLTIPGVWRRPLAGGSEEQVGARPPVFSPDGRLFYRLLERGSQESIRRIEIVDVATGRVVKTLTDPNDLSNLQWAPSNDAILGRRILDNVPNVWRLPIDGGPATQITRFGPGEFNPIYIYTADGKLLFLRIDRLPGEVVQFRNWR